MLRKLLGQIVHVTDASQSPAAQHALTRPQIKTLQGLAREHGFEPLGILSERPLFGALHIFLEVWANPEVPTYLSLTAPPGDVSGASYHFNTSFADGTEILSWGKPVIRTQGGETIDVYAGTNNFAADLAAHTGRVRAKQASQKTTLELSMEDRIAGVERFYETHATGGDLAPLALTRVFLFLMIAVLPCWTAYTTGVAWTAYTMLAIALLPSTFAYCVQRWDRPTYESAPGLAEVETDSPPLARVA